MEIAQVLKKHNKISEHSEVRQLIFHYKELGPVFPKVELPVTPTPQPEPEPEAPVPDERISRLKELLAKEALTHAEIEELNRLMPKNE